MSKAIQGGGFDHIIRRQAAFCGFLTLGRTDVFREMVDKKINQTLFSIASFMNIRENTTLKRFLIV